MEPEFLWVDYDGATQTMNVFLADSNVKPESPTLSTNIDLSALFGGVNDLWVGWTAATSSAVNAHDVVDFSLTAGAGQLGLEATTIDITDFAGTLLPGMNVLAVQGVNLNASDDDFLFRSTIYGNSIEFSEPGFFAEASPGSPNGETGDPPSGSIVFSESSRAFRSNFSLTLTAPSDAAEIRYTTNGEIPGATSTLYTGPISINSSERIRARAFEPGKAPGVVQSHSFVKLSSNLSNYEDGHAFESNIPIMVFESWGRDVHGQDSSLVPVSGLFFEPGEDGVANILDEPSLAARAGMRIRGQTSQGFAKKSYALEFWTEDNSDRTTIRANQAADREVELFGLPAESDWVLHGPYSDKTQLNNFLTFKWSNRIGLYAPRTRLVEAFVNRNGGSLSNSDYVGTYVLLEKIKRDNNRLDLAELTPSDNAEPEITGGYIWKKDKPGAGDRPFRTSRGQELRMVEPGDSDITATQKSWLTDHINDFERALYGSKFMDPDVGYAAYIDVDSWIDTWLLVETTKNIDGFRLSTYYHKDRGGKITQGPAWDYNLSLGNANYLRGAFPDGWYGDSIDSNAYPYWDRLFEDPNFAQQVGDRWQELRQGPWSTDRLLADIDEAVNVLSNGNSRLANPSAGEPSNPISRNYDRWNVLGTYLWPNCFFGQGSCPSSPVGRPNDYGDYINIMRDFVEKRTAWIDTQFPAGPVMSPQPGVIDAGSQ
ncbi:CotH kinase family protein, partial [Planctomycetota bacterium]